MSYICDLKIEGKREEVRYPEFAVCFEILIWLISLVSIWSLVYVDLPALGLREAAVGLRWLRYDLYGMANCFDFILCCAGSEKGFGRIRHERVRAEEERILEH